MVVSSDLNDEMSGDARAEILSEALPAMRHLDELMQLSEDTNDEARGLLKAEIGRVTDVVRRTWSDYRDLLPYPALSRCPFTGELWRHSFDSHGLDGMWWNHRKPLRGRNEPLGGNYYSFRGALERPEQALAIPFLCEPGPEVPFLIPRLMEMPTVTAVISPVAVGPQKGCIVVYFSGEALPDNRRTNEWGSCYVRGYTPDGYLTTEQFYDAEDQYLFDLDRWIEDGRLKWIAPDDPELRIQSTLKNCPFLEMTGQREVWRMQDGKIW